MRVLADAAEVAKLIDGLAEGIREEMQRVHGKALWGFVGIRSRGDILARRLAELVRPDHVGTLDMTLYRDDLTELGPQPVVRTTEIDFDVDGANIVLIDDVLMSGRSVRAALQLLMDLGRPKRVWLAVLADRGGRELPIAADHVGFVLSRDMAEGLEAGQWVDVHLQPVDDRDAIVVRSAGDQRPLEESRETGQGAARG